VRNWARLVKGKVTFDRQAKPAAEFTPNDVDLIARAAGRVSDVAEIDSLAPGNARTAPVSVRDDPEYPRMEGEASTRLFTAHTPKAA
jgi:hypothetical protein